MKKNMRKGSALLLCLALTASVCCVPVGSAAKTVTKKVSKGKILTKNGSVSVSKKKKMIYLKKSGTYTVSGKISGYTLAVAKGKAKIKIELAGADISNKKTSCIYNKYKSTTLTISSKKKKNNTLTGPASYPVKKGMTEADPDAVVCSEGDVVFAGAGSISVVDDSANGEAVHSKEKLTMKSGTCKAVSKKSAFHGEDVYINGGTLNLDSGDTGLESKQNMYIKGGKISVTAGDKGIQAKTGLDISGGTVSVKVQKQNTNKFEDFRGIVAGSTGKKIDGSIRITAGNITVDSFGDCIRASKDVTISGGTFHLKSAGDDGIQAKNILTITGAPVLSIQAEGKKVKGEKKNIAAGIRY